MSHPTVSPRRRALTARAQQRLAEVLQEGDYAVDATVGNGHDTLFLARQVGATGHVWGFDIQADAIAGAREQLLALGLQRRVTLLQRGHQELAEALPAEVHGRLAAVMFNLGYLPGSDKRVTTQAGTTLAALVAARAQLRPGGLLSVLAYRGHPGGQQEADAVAAWLARSDLQVEVAESPGPVLYLARRPAGGAAG
jgi:predicted methyltransferase